MTGPATLATVASSRSIMAAARAAENAIQVAFVTVLGCMILQSERNESVRFILDLRRPLYIGLMPWLFS
jgi:hypothetical protein